MSKVKFKRGTTDEIENMDIEDGSLLYNVETGDTYMDCNDKRIQTGGKPTEGTSAGDTLPVGTIVGYSTEDAPTNWLLCDGGAHLKSDYPELYKVIGETYGTPEDSEYFFVPDYTGRVGVGIDHRDDDFFAIGNTFGEKQHTMTVEELAEHNHIFALRFSGTGPQSGDYGRYLTGGKDYDTIEKTGESKPFNVVQPSIVQSYIIKAKNSVGLVGNVVNDINATGDNDVPNAKTVKEVTTNVVYEKTFTSDTLIRDFKIEGLDIVRDGGVYEMIILGRATSMADLNMHFNKERGANYGLIISTNFQTANGTSDSTVLTETAGQYRYNQLGVYYGFGLYAEKISLIKSQIMLSGNTLCCDYMARSAFKNEQRAIDGFSWMDANVDNLTSLDFNPTDATNKFKSGTKILIVKKCSGGN